MRYYSEDTVRDIIKGVAHTALEQTENYADAILQNQPSIEIKEPHGELIERDTALTALMYAMCGSGYQSMAMREIRSEMTCPTIVEAST